MSTNPWNNPGCPIELWRELTLPEKEKWRRLYRAFNNQINMPVGVHVLKSVVRDLATQYCNITIWTLRKYKEEITSGSNKEPDDDLSGVRAQDEAREGHSVCTLCSQVGPPV